MKMAQNYQEVSLYHPGYTAGLVAESHDSREASVESSTSKTSDQQKAIDSLRVCPMIDRPSPVEAKALGLKQARDSDNVGRARNESTKTDSWFRRNRKKKIFRSPDPSAAGINKAQERQRLSSALTGISQICPPVNGIYYTMGRQTERHMRRDIVHRKQDFACMSRDQAKIRSVVQSRERVYGESSPYFAHMKIPLSVLDQWIRDLTIDGDVEGNPGPTTNILCFVPKKSADELRFFVDLTPLPMLKVHICESIPSLKKCYDLSKKHNCFYQYIYVDDDDFVAKFIRLWGKNFIKMNVNDIKQSLITIDTHKQDAINKHKQDTHDKIQTISALTKQAMLAKQTNGIIAGNKQQKELVSVPRKATYKEPRPANSPGDVQRILLAVDSNGKAIEIQVLNNCYATVAAARQVQCVESAEFNDDDGDFDSALPTHVLHSGKWTQLWKLHDGHFSAIDECQCTSSFVYHQDLFECQAALRSIIEVDMRQEMDLIRLQHKNYLFVVLQQQILLDEIAHEVRTKALVQCVEFGYQQLGLYVTQTAERGFVKDEEQDVWATIIEKHEMNHVKWLTNPEVQDDVDIDDCRGLHSTKKVVHYDCMRQAVDTERNVKNILKLLAEGQLMIVAFNFTAYPSDEFMVWFPAVVYYNPIFSSIYGKRTTTTIVDTLHGTVPIVHHSNREFSARTEMGDIAVKDYTVFDHTYITVVGANGTLQPLLPEKIRLNFLGYRRFGLYRTVKQVFLGRSLPELLGQVHFGSNIKQNAYPGVAQPAYGISNEIVAMDSALLAKTTGALAVRVIDSKEAKQVACNAIVVASLMRDLTYANKCTANEAMAILSQASHLATAMRAEMAGLASLNV